MLLLLLWPNFVLKIDLLTVFLAVDRMKSRLPFTSGFAEAKLCKLCVSFISTSVVWYRTFRVNMGSCRCRLHVSLF